MELSQERFQLTIAVNLRKVGPNGEYIGGLDTLQVFENHDLGNCTFDNALRVIGELRTVSQELQSRVQGEWQE